MRARAGAASKLFSISFYFLFLELMICLEGAFRSEAQHAKQLPREELAALKSVGQTLGKDWNFEVNPCNDSSHSTRSWITIPDLFPGWKNSVTCECNPTCHVVAIQLKAQSLNGSLPDELADLTFLRQLDLTHNYLSGQIPATWATLPLTNLSLLGNRISGKIPKEIGNITTLLEMFLDDNQIEGFLPPELGNLTKLKRLLISSNNFIGPLPVELGKLKNLTDFRITDNGFNGTIPDFIQNWTKLKKLHIQGTSLRGPLPSSISALRNLEDMRISDLSGPDSSFPNLQDMTSLRYLTLRNCFISGELPTYFGDGSKGNLRLLDLSFNNLTGKIPDNFAILKLNFMFLTNNMLNGTIPGWIIHRSLKADVSYNNFTGVPISDTCVRNNLNLAASYSSTANIPYPCLRKNLPCLEQPRNYALFINCGGPSMIIDKKEYEADTNELGEASFYSSSNGRWAVSNTGLFMDGDQKGYIATANDFELSMPNRELYMNARLSPLSLKYYGFCLQEGSYNVTLHFAEVQFTDDQTYKSLGRRIFDISIQGVKVLPDFNIQRKSNGHPGAEVVITFTTNVTHVTNNTLEIHLFWAGRGTATIPVRGIFGPLISAITVTANFKPRMFESSKLSAGVIAGIVLASCVVLFLILGILWMKGLLGGEDPVDKELRRDLERQTGYFTLRQIKEATNSFDPANKIGEGGFGPVYKIWCHAFKMFQFGFDLPGQLPDGSTIAVKQLSSKSKQGNREFVNEIGMISALQHPNLVKLFGCCIESNQLLLIYEYMENNSLARALFGPEESRLNLDWPTRHKICLGIARGLTYLHEESRLKIVHRDIKATNVLLDKNLNAKISDFGLAKLDEEENTHISTRIAGTIGYMAPEYATRGYLTDKADIYSFGIVALEIVSGKSNTNYMPKEEFVYLLDWAYVLQERGDLLELVDPSLGTKFSKEQALTMLNLALHCTNQSPTLRPKMSTVVSMLEGQTTAVKAPVIKASVSSSSSSTNHWRFKALELVLQHSETQSMSMEDPWIDSSISNPSKDEEMGFFSKDKSQSVDIDSS